MSGKYALIIGNTEYFDPGLAQLTAPGKDADDFARVLSDKEICAFDDVKTLLNQSSHVIRETIDEFFYQKKPDDLIVFYFSGHGVRDELGKLYLAVKNTNRFRLRSTAIRSDFIREAMDQSRSRRQLLILDCCNSGAFSQGTKAATGVSIGTSTAFESGYGRIILTASDSTQFAWEGDKVIGETDNSLFTHFLVQGLEGIADRDGDGKITVDELYDYAYEQVKLSTPKQTPSKFSSKQQGEIILRQNIPIDDTIPVPLPDDLTIAMNSSLTYIREGAVRQLEELLRGRNLGLARSARTALEKIAKEDDSRHVSRIAGQALEEIQQVEQSALKKNEIARSPRQKTDEEQPTETRRKEERLAKQKAELERKTKQEAENLAKQSVEEKRLAEEKANKEDQGKELLKRENIEIRKKSEQTENAEFNVDSIWKFGKLEILQSIVGIGLSTILYYLLTVVLDNHLFLWAPAYFVSFFFGLVFGPIVGATVGASQYIIFMTIDFYPVYGLFPFANNNLGISTTPIFSHALEGLIMGFAKIPLINFRSLRGILRAELFVLISILATSLVFTNWAFIFRDTNHYILLLKNQITPLMLWTLILTPSFMVIYSFTKGKITSSSRNTNINRQKHIWKLSKKEIWQSAAGLVIFTALYYLFPNDLQQPSTWKPTIIVLLFFGLLFGPVVGGIVGGGSYIIYINALFYNKYGSYFYTEIISQRNIYMVSEIYLISTISMFAFALIGSIMGLAKVRLSNFRSLRGILRAELFVILSLTIPTIIFTNWNFYFVSPSRLISFMNQQLLSYLGALILIPLSMIAYSFVSQKIEKLINLKENK